MSIVAPKARKYLCADALFRLIRSGFANIAEYRYGDVEISFTDALMSAFAMFSLKAPSLLAFDKERARAMCRPSTGSSVSRVTRTGASALIRSPPSGSARCSRASFGNSSAARRLKRGCFWMATIEWPLMARGIFPPRRFTVPHVCTKSTVMGRSPTTIRCWAQPLSIQTGAK